MTAMAAEKHEDGHAAEPQVEDEVAALVRKGVGQMRRPPEGTETVSTLNSVITRVSGTTVMEIEGLISQLQGIRDHLRQEADRVQREIAQYTQMSRTAAQSTRVIAETLSQWKR